MQIALERMVCHSNSAETTATNKDPPLLHYLIVQNDDEPMLSWAQVLLVKLIQVYLQLLHATGNPKKIPIPSCCRIAYYTTTVPATEAVEFVLW